MYNFKIHAVNNSIAKPVNEFVSVGRRKILIKYPCEDKTNCTLVSVTFPPGVFRIECWGASGGDRSSDIDDGGKGAYTKGEIAFSEKRTLFLSIGASGDSVMKPKYGGGGQCISNSPFSRTGGGSTDVRLENDEDFIGLKSRIMVAAAGGGAANHASVSKAGFGGNLTGSISSATINNNCATTETYNLSIPANQTHGGISSKGSALTDNGSFGKGGSLLNLYGGSGGGGYYGGGAGNCIACFVITGAGGSSFISGYEGCDAIDKNSTEGHIWHTGDKIHYSGVYFTAAEMKSGEQKMPQPGLISQYQIGHRGNGFVRITLMSLVATCKRQTLHTFSFLIFLMSLMISY